MRVSRFRMAKRTLPTKLSAGRDWLFSALHPPPLTALTLLKGKEWRALWEELLPVLKLQQKIACVLMCGGCAASSVRRWPAEKGTNWNAIVYKAVWGHP